NVFVIANMSKTRTTVNGKAETSDAVCKADKPPVYNKTAAVPEMSTPHTIFSKSGGWIDPFDVILAKMYVAESADVTRKMKMNAIANVFNSGVSGRCSIVTNNACVKSRSTARAMFVPAYKSLQSAVPPNTAIHVIAMSGGMSMTPIMNSRTVRPFD